MKPRPRQQVTEGRTYCIQTGCGNFYITINNDVDGVCELFARLGKSGGCQSSQNETIGRLISISLRSGINPQEVIEMLKGVRCPRPFVGHALSCSDAIARALSWHINGKKNETSDETTDFELSK